MGDLTTAAAYKTFAGISHTAWDTLIATLVTQVSKSVQSWCQDKIEAADYVEDHDGYGQESIILHHRPLNSVAYVRDDVNWDFPASSDVSSDFWRAPTGTDNPGILYFWGYRVTTGVRNVRVSYNAGYATIPADVALACHMWIGHIMEQRKDRGLTNQSLGDRSFGLDLSEIPADVALLLRPYQTRVRMS